MMKLCAFTSGAGLGSGGSTSSFGNPIWRREPSAPHAKPGCALETGGLPASRSGFAEVPRPLTLLPQLGVCSRSPSGRKWRECWRCSACVSAASSLLSGEPVAKWTRTSRGGCGTFNWQRALLWERARSASVALGWLAMEEGGPRHTAHCGHRYQWKWRTAMLRRDSSRCSTKPSPEQHETKPRTGPTHSFENFKPARQAPPYIFFHAIIDHHNSTITVALGHFSPRHQLLLHHGGAGFDPWPRPSGAGVVVAAAAAPARTADERSGFRGDALCGVLGRRLSFGAFIGSNLRANTRARE